jgi:tRNA threonylcarbamoyladenosine biosynthesis protein TsaE
MQPVHIVSHSATETANVAGIVARELRARDVLLLAGDLGAGKTAFTKALCAALGVGEPVTSPTFTLVHEYQGGSLRVCHADVYRLERTGELADLGLEEARRLGAVLVIEWGDLVAEAFDDALVLTFGHAGDDRRTIDFSYRGTQWESRFSRLYEKLRAVGAQR